MIRRIVSRILKARMKSPTRRTAERSAGEEWIRERRWRRRGWRWEERVWRVCWRGRR